MILSAGDGDFLFVLAQTAGPPDTVGWIRKGQARMALDSSTLCKARPQGKKTV